MFYNQCGCLSAASATAAPAIIVLFRFCLAIDYNCVSLAAGGIGGTVGPGRRHKEHFLVDLAHHVVNHLSHILIQFRRCLKVLHVILTGKFLALLI